MIGKEILSEIILDYQENELPTIVERELQNHIDLEIPLNRAIAILGPRRSGKTFFLYSLIKKLIRKGIEKERTLYLNFENPKLITMDLKDLISLLDTFMRFIRKIKSKRFGFF